MRIALIVVGVLCLLVGCIWILQGINVLPGSFMSGHTKWSLYGGLVMIVGIALLVRRRKNRAIPFGPFLAFGCLTVILLSRGLTTVTLSF